jgi:hypothetical protein
MVGENSGTIVGFKIANGEALGENFGKHALVSWIVLTS